jgi:hypothetical protein
MTYSREQQTGPVLAIVTKFDNFVDDIRQELEEKMEEDGLDVTEDELVETSQRKATEILNLHYIRPLMDLPHPPKAVVSLSYSGLIFIPYSDQSD